MSALVGAAQQALDVLLQALDAQSNPARREFPTIHDFGQMRRVADTLKAALVPHECTCSVKDMPFGRCCKAQAEPTAWIEHHKGGDNLCWEDPGGTKTPLYAALRAALARQDEPVACAHDIYKTGDQGVPPQILDKNGEVVLAMCKKCGKAESELSQAPRAERTLLEQHDLDQSPEYRKGYEDGRHKGYEVGHRHATDEKALTVTRPCLTRPTCDQLLALRRSLPMEAGDAEFAFAVLSTYGVTK